jgi:hypothetical protein
LPIFMFFAHGIQTIECHQAAKRALLQKKNIA